MYNLDVIISVGYRVKSVQGTRFRQWANNILKQYLIKGYAVNQKRLDHYDDLKSVVNLMSRAWGGGKDIVKNASIHINHYYTKAWNVYKEKMQRPDVYFAKNAKDAQKLITREMRCTEKNYTILRFLQKMRYDKGEVTL